MTEDLPITFKSLCVVTDDGPESAGNVDSEHNDTEIYMNML